MSVNMRSGELCCSGRRGMIVPLEMDRTFEHNVRLVSPGMARLCFATLITCAALRAEAAAVSSEDVPVLGGTAALASALGIDPVPDRARFLFEVTRLIYDSAEIRRPAAQAFLESLRMQGNR